MASSSEYTVTSFKSACDKGQNWITNRMEKFNNQANKFSTLKNGYNKIRPRIFPKGLNSLKREDFEESCEDDFDNFLRPRFHSIDVIDNKVREELSSKICDTLDQVPEDVSCCRNEVRKSRETLLAEPNIELTVIDAITTPKRYDRLSNWKSMGKKDKIIVKSIDDDNSLKVLPAVLLTYNPKFIKISDSRKNSVCNANSIESSLDLSA